MADLIPGETAKQPETRPKQPAKPLFRRPKNTPRNTTETTAPKQPGTTLKQRWNKAKQQRNTTSETAEQSPIGEANLFRPSRAPSYYPRYRSVAFGLLRLALVSILA
jgi:hypothetical protein